MQVRSQRKYASYASPAVLTYAVFGYNVSTPATLEFGVVSKVKAMLPLLVLQFMLTLLLLLLLPVHLLVLLLLLLLQLTSISASYPRRTTAQTSARSRLCTAPTATTRHHTSPYGACQRAGKPQRTTSTARTVLLLLLLRTCRRRTCRRSCCLCCWRLCSCSHACSPSQ